jgi:outer membrane lipoprotein-sorting protein
MHTRTLQSLAIGTLCLLGAAGAAAQAKTADPAPQPAAAQPGAATAKPKSKEELVGLLKTIDDRQRNQGDWRSETYIEQKEKGKVAVVYNAIVFRRSADARFMIVFTAPKNVAGQGYLRVDKNLWFYDPSVGKWERRTERERIGGTNSRRSDFDESRLAEEYDPTDDGEEKLGVYMAQKLTLKGKSGLDLAFPVIKLWVDRDTKNVLKRQEFALSGRLLRTSYYPKWKKVHSESKKADVWFPQEIRFYDEVEKENSTLVLIKSVDLKALEPNLFTKAWLESRSR